MSSVRFPREGMYPRIRARWSPFFIPVPLRPAWIPLEGQLAGPATPLSSPHGSHSFRRIVPLHSGVRTACSREHQALFTCHVLNVPVDLVVAA